MKYKDYYKILGLETSRVSIEEIKAAYRAAVKRNHPDVNVGDSLAEEKIKDINEAYRTLSAPASKRKYDRIWNSRTNAKNYQKFKGKNIFSMFLGDIDKEEIGITVAYDDVEGWINAIHRIADHPEEAQKMGANARKLAEKRFNLEIFSREIAESLLEISKMSPKKRTFA